MSGGTGIVRVSAEAGAAATWLISGNADAGGDPGHITFTGTAGDTWMVWGELDTYTNCDAVSLGAGSYGTWLVTVTADGTVTLNAVDSEHYLVALKII
jgi:hypothetical protein